MPKRGDKHPETGKFFWRKDSQREYWVDEEELNRRRFIEKQRADRFYAKNPNYLALSHTQQASRERAKKYRTNHPDRVKKSFFIWAQKNKDKRRDYSRMLYKKCPEHRAKVRAYSAVRRTMQKRLSGEEAFCVKFLYKLAQSISSAGVKHVVDHILPIKPVGGRYCGLTNSSNLRVIPKVENRRKKNRCPIYGGMKTQYMQ